MGQARSKQRECPVIGRVISAAECAGDRISRYACPESCPNNPWSVANYSKALEIDERARAKMIRRAVAESGRDTIARMFEDEMDAPFAFLKHTVWDRDRDGRTFFERWKADGMRELGNDERVLVDCQARTRIVAGEILEVRDNGTCLVQDRLQPDSPPFLICDRTFTRHAVRFARWLGPVFPAPCYTRTEAVGVTIPEVGPLESEEILRAVGRRLGAPEEHEAFVSWIPAHLPRIAEAFEAVARTFRNIALEDARKMKKHSAGFAYRDAAGTRDRLAALLEASADVRANDLSPEDREEGWDRSYICLTAGGLPEPEATAGFDPGPEFSKTLGTVLLGPASACVYTLGMERNPDLRSRFEAIAGDLVVFEKEWSASIMPAEALGEEPEEADLCPPEFLTHAPRFAFLSYQARLSKEEAQSALATSQRQWIHASLPALDAKTPLQAAADPQLRPRLVGLMKSFLRQEKTNRREGGTSLQPGWEEIARELGLRELEPPRGHDG